jgi:hypothetical protein
MPERTLEAFEFKGPKPRTIRIIIILLIIILFFLFWGPFAIIPAGHRGSSSGGEVLKRGPWEKGSISKSPWRKV